MGDIDVEAIKARADAATPGPWETVITREDTGLADPNVPEVYWTFEICNDDESIAYSTALDDPAADAEFIAAARQDIPALLAEVTRLRSVVAEAEALAEELATSAESCLRKAKATTDEMASALWFSDHRTQRNVARRLRSVLSDTTRGAAQ